jgi:hypothetical protein
MRNLKRSRWQDTELAGISQRVCRLCHNLPAAGQCRWSPLRVNLRRRGILTARPAYPQHRKCLRTASTAGECQEQASASFRSITWSVHAKKAVPRLIWTPRSIAPATHPGRAGLMSRCRMLSGILGTLIAHLYSSDALHRTCDHRCRSSLGSGRSQPSRQTKPVSIPTDGLQH